MCCYCCPTAHSIISASNIVLWSHGQCNCQAGIQAALFFTKTISQVMDSQQILVFLAVKTILLSKGYDVYAGFQTLDPWFFFFFLGMMTGWNLVTAFCCPAPMLLCIFISFLCELFFFFINVLIKIGDYPCRACVVKYTVLQHTIMQPYAMTQNNTIQPSDRNPWAPAAAPFPLPFPFPNSVSDFRVPVKYSVHKAEAVTRITGKYYVHSHEGATSHTATAHHSG